MSKQRMSAFRALVVVLALVLAAACGGGGSSKATSTTKSVPKRVAAASRVAAAAPVAPLTGLPDPKNVARKRPAVTVKVNNTGSAKQYGIDQADVIYEEVVEGGITRLAAIFNSQAPDRVGPVRSVRKTDQSIVWPIGGIFAYSGGAQYAIDSIDTAPVKQLDESRAGSMMYRAPGSEFQDPVSYTEAPFNLWAKVDEMFNAGGTPIPPPPLFSYRKAGVKPGGTPAVAVVVNFAAGYAITWNWDPKTGTWLRSKFGGPDTTADGVRLAPKNVVVMSVQYLGGAGVEQSEAQLQGSGSLSVFTGGKEIKGTWSRPDKSKPARLLNSTGGAIRLTPGQTWVELPDVSYPVKVLP
jgi:hypothetical protein